MKKIIIDGKGREILEKNEDFNILPPIILESPIGNIIYIIGFTDNWCNCSCCKKNSTIAVGYVDINAKIRGFTPSYIKSCCPIEE